MKLRSEYMQMLWTDPSVEAIYWYMGQGLDQIVLMARYQKDRLQVQVNLKDFDFALHVDAIEIWKNDLIETVQTVLSERWQRTQQLLKSVDKSTVP